MNLGPSLDDLPLDAVAGQALARRREDMQELMRLAAVSALANGGRHLSPVELRDVKARAAVPPLSRPLGTGDPGVPIPQLQQQPQQEPQQFPQQRGG